MRVELPEALFDRTRPLWVLGEGDPRRVDGPLPARLYVTPGGEAEERVSAADSGPAAPRRPYIAGGLNRIWASGEPLVIVRPTQGDDAALAGPGRPAVRLPVARDGLRLPRADADRGIPVVDDTSVTAATMARCNLVLVGPASANAVLRRLTDRLPVREVGDHLEVGARRLAFAGRVYGLFAANPEAPQRYLGVISAARLDSLDPAVVSDFLNDEGPFGFRLRQVEPTAHTVASVRWTAQWQPQVEAGDEAPLPAGLEMARSGEAAWARAAAAAGADYHLTYLAADTAALAWDRQETMWGDLRAELDRPADLRRTWLTGAELLRLAAAVRDTLADAAFVPEVQAAQLRPQALYPVSMEWWVTWDLASRLHRNLPNVERVSTDQVWRRFVSQQDP